MKEYLGALIATTLLGGIVRMLAPEGKLQKYLRLSVSLCLVAALLGPLLGALGEERDFSLGEMLSEDENPQMNYDEIYHHSLENATKTQAEQIIQAKIYQKFSLSEETARITANFVTENDKLELSEIYVSLRGTGILSEPRAVVDFVRAEWDCPCVILYE